MMDNIPIQVISGVEISSYVIEIEQFQFLCAKEDSLTQGLAGAQFMLTQVCWWNKWNKDGTIWIPGFPNKNT